MTRLALFSSLLKMVVLGSLVGERLGACFIFKPSEMVVLGPPEGVTRLSLFSNLLKMIALGSPGGE